MDDSHKVILRLFNRAAARIGNARLLALHLRLSDEQLAAYLMGKALPPDEVLLRAVDLILDELPGIRADVSPEVWRSLFPTQ